MKSLDRSPGFLIFTLCALAALAPLAAWGQQQSSLWHKVHVTGAKKEGLQVYRHAKNPDQLLFENMDATKMMKVGFRLTAVTEFNSKSLTTETTRDRFDIVIPPKGTHTFMVPPGAPKVLNSGDTYVKIINISRHAPATPSPFAPKKPN